MFSISGDFQSFYPLFNIFYLIFYEVIPRESRDGDVKMVDGQVFDLNLFLHVARNFANTFGCTVMTFN